MTYDKHQIEELEPVSKAINASHTLQHMLIGLAIAYFQSVCFRFKSCRDRVL